MLICFTNNALDIARKEMFVASAELDSSHQYVPEGNAETCRSEWPPGLWLEHWRPGFQSHSIHGCLCSFILFVLFCVKVAALGRADPRQRSPTNLDRITKQKKRPGHNNGMQSAMFEWTKEVNTEHLSQYSQYRNIKKVGAGQWWFVKCTRY
jgi:hypothetical protein